MVRAGAEILSNVVASQIATHAPYGGVVPELASREHLRAIVPVVRQALAEANQTYNSIDAIAVPRKVQVWQERFSSVSASPKRCPSHLISRSSRSIISKATFTLFC